MTASLMSVEKSTFLRVLIIADLDLLIPLNTSFVLARTLQRENKTIAISKDPLQYKASALVVRALVQLEFISRAASESLIAFSIWFRLEIKIIQMKCR